MGSEMARATTAEMARRCRGWEKALLDSGDEIGAEEHHHWADRLTELAAEVERLRGFSAQVAHAIGLVDGALDVFDPGWHSAYFDDKDTAIIRAAAEAARREKEQEDG